MDKWDNLGVELIAAADADDEKRGLRVALVFVKEFARAVEDVGAQLDRIATALETGK